MATCATRQTRTRLAWLAILIGVGLVAAALLAALAARPARAEATGAAGGVWACQARPWQVADRFGDWTADSDALGNALPDGYLATISTHTRDRYFHLVLYSPVGGDLTVDVPFDRLAAEAGTTFPTGRFDPIGKPSLSYHGGQIKIVVGLWGGGGGAEDRGGRIYTWCGIAGA